MASLVKVRSLAATAPIKAWRVRRHHNACACLCKWLCIALPKDAHVSQQLHRNSRLSAGQQGANSWREAASCQSSTVFERDRILILRRFQSVSGHECAELEGQLNVRLRAGARPLNNYLQFLKLRHVRLFCSCRYTARAAALKILKDVAGHAVRLCCRKSRVASCFQAGCSLNSSRPPCQS